MDEGLLPAAVREAAADRRGGATEVAARALDGLLEVAGDRGRLEAAVAALLAGQPAMAPIWHLARAARGPDPGAALARLRATLDADADAAVDAAAAWLRPRLAGGGRDAVATVSHSSLVDRVLARLDPGGVGAAGPTRGPEAGGAAAAAGGAAAPAVGGVGGGGAAGLAGGDGGGGLLGAPAAPKPPQRGPRGGGGGPPAPGGGPP